MKHVFSAFFFMDRRLGQHIDAKNQNSVFFTPEA